MLEALPQTQPGWLTFAELAERIADRDLYTRGDGARADAGQLRRRATQSNGYYVHLFEVEGNRIRRRQD
jgi:hypothetical protein